MLDSLKGLLKAVQAKEPDVLIYYALHAKDQEGQDEIIVIER